MAMSPPSLTFVEPASTIFPSDCSATSPSNSKPPKSTPTVPPVPKLESALPSGCRRLTTKSWLTSPVPMTTIRPFCWIAIAKGLLIRGGEAEGQLSVAAEGRVRSAVALPAWRRRSRRIPRHSSRRPSRSSRRTGAATPLATSVPPKSTNAFPGVAGANDVSTLPSALRRVATMSLFGPPWPTATILPPGASATATRSQRHRSQSSASRRPRSPCPACRQRLAGQSRSRRRRRCSSSRRERACRRADEPWRSRSSVPPKSTTEVPAPPPANVVSRVPFAFSRLVTKSLLALPWPEMTICSLGSTTTPPPMSFTPGWVPNVALPPEPKLLSGAPSDPNRATAKSPPPVASVEPIATIRPSGVIATCVARSVPPKLSVCLPSALNEVSRSPGAARATAS